MLIRQYIVVVYLHFLILIEMIFNFIKTSKVYNLLLIILFSCFYITGVCGSTDESSADKATATTLLHMPFKMGIELQEIGGLCPEALNDITVQRKPLFCMPVEGRANSLWHVVIDTNDIEFVTSPYSAEEGAVLNRCLDTLSAAFQFLKTSLEARETITFDEWIAGIPGVQTLPDYPLVHDKLIIKPPKWVPTFAPQVTIQHPLEWTIPLYFGLFGFNSADMLTFCGSFPYRDSVLKSAEEADSRKLHAQLAEQGKKINGLVFLHALTLLQISPMEETKAEEALKETLTSLSKCYQVDAKMKLSLMSRRPFSAMYKDIEKDMLVSYEQYFKESILDFNESFTSSYEVPRYFHFANYGEQFWDADIKSVKSLERLADSSLFEGEFFSKNEVLIRQLLGQGVITTTMIRNSIPWAGLFVSYFEEALNLSRVSHPRHDLDVSGAPETLVVSHETLSDVLSPPWLLGSQDSMGRFKDEIAAEDKKYGEAIIEVRGIRNVGPWFLKKASLEGTSTSGNFLSNPDKIILESMHLFGFLTSFTQGHFSDIYTGVLSALQRF